jgi:hypothetical protein
VGQLDRLTQTYVEAVLAAQIAQYERVAATFDARVAGREVRIFGENDVAFAAAYVGLRACERIHTAFGAVALNHYDLCPNALARRGIGGRRERTLYGRRGRQRRGGGGGRAARLAESGAGIAGASAAAARRQGGGVERDVRDS